MPTVYIDEHTPSSSFSLLINTFSTHSPRTLHRSHLIQLSHTRNMAFISDTSSDMHIPDLMSSPRTRWQIIDHGSWHDEAGPRLRGHISPSPPYSSMPPSPRQSEAQAAESSISTPPSPDSPGENVRVQLWEEDDNRLFQWSFEFDTVLPPGMDTGDLIECLNLALYELIEEKLIEDDLIEPDSDLTQLTDGAPPSQEERIERCRQFANSLPTFSPEPRFNRDTGCNAGDFENWSGDEEGSPEPAAAHFPDFVRSPTPSEIQERKSFILSTGPPELILRRR